MFKQKPKSFSIKKRFNTWISKSFSLEKLFNAGHWKSCSLDKDFEILIKSFSNEKLFESHVLKCFSTEKLFAKCLNIFLYIKTYLCDTFNMVFSSKSCTRNQKKTSCRWLGTMRLETMRLEMSFRCDHCDNGNYETVADGLYGNQTYTTVSM